MALTPRKSFKTEKGTELPLLNLKGKEYLQIMHRLVWFKERYPESKGLIKTQMIEHQGVGPEEYFIFRAEIFVDSERGPMLVATGHKREAVKNFADAMEKAESGAVGRALAMLGIGTSFAADDLDEGDRLADAPAPVFEKTTQTNTEVTGADNVAANAVVSSAANGGRRPSFRKNVTVTSSTGDDI